MTNDQRIEVYVRGKLPDVNGAPKLTPRQRRRATKHENRTLALGPRFIKK